MNVNNIKAELIMKNVKQTEIARSLGITSASVNEVITGRRKNPRIREAIAAAINKPVSEIWPEAEQN